MTIKYFHLGLRQVVMVLMDWAINVPQELLQSAAKTQPFTILFNSFIIIILYLFCCKLF